MPNPIYILHLSDWHLSKENVENFNKKKNFDNLLDNLSKRISKFLNKKGRSHLDYIALTGDMFDRNINPEYSANKVNFFLKDLRSDELTKTFCAPGNHDVFDKSVSDCLKASNFAKLIINKDIYQNYILADYLAEELQPCFKNFKIFCKEIKATNINNSLIGSYYNIDHQNPTVPEIFVSWYNTSWLCVGKDWKMHKNIDSEDGRFRDNEKITSGNLVNQIEFEKFAEFKLKNKNSNKSKSFSFSLFHHYPRILNHFDIYNLKHLTKRTNTSIDTVNEYEKHLRITEDRYNICNLGNKSFYNCVKEYDLVLNGHTHGKLYDSPFSTTTGIFTPESTVLNCYIDIIEVDLYRGFYIIHHFPLYGEDENGVDNKITTDFRVYRDEYFVDKMKSNYTEVDLYNDLRLNGELSIYNSSVAQTLISEDLVFEANSIKNMLKKP